MLFRTKMLNAGHGPSWSTFGDASPALGSVHEGWPRPMSSSAASTTLMRRWPLLGLRLAHPGNREPMLVDPSDAEGATCFRGTSLGPPAAKQGTRRGQLDQAQANESELNELRHLLCSLAPTVVVCHPHPWMATLRHLTLPWAVPNGGHDGARLDRSWVAPANETKS